MVHKTAVMTVEGLGSIRSGHHPVQERISKGHGSQCGFCTPGMIMSMYALLRNNANPTQQEIETALQGNLCRCTGYRPIIEAFGSMGCGSENCCKNKASPGAGAADAAGGGDAGHLTDWDSLPPYEPSQEPIFPPQLLVHSLAPSETSLIRGVARHCLYQVEKPSGETVELRGSRVRLLLPTTLGGVWSALGERKGAVIVASGLNAGFAARLNAEAKETVWVSLRDVAELQQCKWNETSMNFEMGATLTISRLSELLQLHIDSKPEEETVFLREFQKCLERIGSRQLRNISSWGGNLLAGSHISDLSPALLASGASLQVMTAGGERWFPMDGETFQEGPTLRLEPGEILSAARLPLSDKNTVFRSYKAGSGSGYADYGNVVTAAFRIRFNAASDVVGDAAFAFAGMAKRPLLAPKTAQCLLGKALDSNALELASTTLLQELGLGAEDEGGRILYRNNVALSFLFKFFLHCQSWLSEKRGGQALDQRTVSILNQPEFTPLKATQIFQEAKTDEATSDPVGRPLRNVNADKQVTGEALYLGDISVPGACELVPILSRRSSALIRGVDASEALALPGVLAYVDKSDIPVDGTNYPFSGAEGGMAGDRTEMIFAEGEVSSVGQIIGAIVAEDEATARRAARLVKVDYEDLPNPILTLEDAIARESFYGGPVVNEHGDVAAMMAESAVVVEGELRLGGQEHMYMETHCSLIVPEDGDMWAVRTTTQAPGDVQKAVAEILGHIPYSNVRVQTIRLGGAFGGKISQYPTLWPSAVAAHKLRRPIRGVLTRREDMVATGKRHPIYAKYKVGVDKDGKLKAIEVQMYLDGGHTADQSPMICMVSTLRFGNAYRADAWRVVGRACRTNLPSNTAFRAYGTPQSYFVTEVILNHVSEKLGLTPEQVRERNLVSPGTLSMQMKRVLEDDDAIQRCWAEAKARSDFTNLSNDVARFNRENAYLKRGVAMVPTRWGIGMAGMGFEQGAVLVHIYTDGSVLISHAGIEMGQGLNTKVLQVAARVLGIPADGIRVGENATDKVPNPTTTGGSQGSDIHALAAKVACEKLMERLKFIREANPKAEWAELIKKANEARVGLSATGMGRPNFEKGGEMQIRYFTSGVAATLVEIDTLTGDHRILSTDIVMDVGDSLNPAVDIGQIEGAFAQGYGLFVTEELAYSDKTGALLSDSAGKYRIPRVGNTPRVFRVSLLHGHPERHNLYSSRGIGEPPLFLGHSVYAAIRKAVIAAREEFGESGEHLTFSAPATAERIRLACGRLRT